MRIFCDWGSSNLRAYLFDDGEVVDRYASELGSKTIAADEDLYHAELKRITIRFDVAPDTPIQLSGMVGSKNGWLDAGYIDTPAAVADLAGSLVSPPGFSSAVIVPGLKHERENSSIDLMRGEETQVFGLLSIDPAATRICLPGTHSKWVEVAGGRITAFQSYMTGDLFSALCERSIFREQIGSEDFDEESFIAGCTLAYAGCSLDDLFRLRSDYVCAKVSQRGFHSYLSGFLIANEIRAAGASGSVHLCGSESLTKAYAMALDQISVESIAIAAEAATIAGHIELGKAG